MHHAQRLWWRTQRYSRIAVMRKVWTNADPVAPDTKGAPHRPRLPNANMTLRGIAGSGNYRCSKIVSKTFTTNGSVVLNFAQSDAGCTTIGMKRWSDIPLRLTN